MGYREFIIELLSKIADEESLERVYRLAEYLYLRA